MRSFAHVGYEVRDGVAWITMSRPERLNAFTTEFYGEIRDAVRLGDNDPTVDVLVLLGTPEAFGTGGDLGEVLAHLDPDADPLDLYRFEDELPFHAIRSSPKVVVSVVRGNCLAGGLVIACEADISIVQDDARLGVPEARVGIAESWSPAVLAPRVSMAKLKYLLLTGATIDAREAERIGLITEVATAESLFARVEEVVVQLRRCSPAARSSYKRILNSSMARGQGVEMWEAMRSADGREGLAAFLEKRPPSYSGD